MSTELQPTVDGTSEKALKVTYTHRALIDAILLNPEMRQRDLAALFDRSESWISMVVNNDAFQALLEERRKELIDPIITGSAMDRMGAVAQASLEIIQKRLEQIAIFPTKENDEFVLKTADLAFRAKGYGARNAPKEDAGPRVAVVVQVPAKIESAEEWAKTHFPSSRIIDS